MATTTLSDCDLLLLIDEHIGRLEGGLLAATRAERVAMDVQRNALNDKVRREATLDLEEARAGAVLARGGISALKELRAALRGRGVR
jgi:hypothetical protein